MAAEVFEFQAALREELGEGNAFPFPLYEATDYGRTATEEYRDGNLLQRGSNVLSTAVSQTLAELPPHGLQPAVVCCPTANAASPWPEAASPNSSPSTSARTSRNCATTSGPCRTGPSNARRVRRSPPAGRLRRLRLAPLRGGQGGHAELVQEHGGKVVLFTGTWLSPTATPSEMVLPSQVAAPSPYDILVPTLAVIETLAAAVITALGEDAQQRTRRGEDTAADGSLLTLRHPVIPPSPTMPSPLHRVSDLRNLAGK